MRGLALVLALVWLVPYLAAGAGDVEYYRVVGVDETEVLNLREDPGVDSEIIASLRANATGILGLGCVGGPSPGEWDRMNAAERAAVAERERWCKVHFRGLIGWAAAWHLTTLSVPEPQQ